ncbi:MAG: hypothetical protein A2096_14465 [Spirochaetes bacterium GWF1_41_5]|nr:MAG: hypothetical protein A2096_14465 [Spirochaetes bacterium GWF1_41_5]
MLVDSFFFQILEKNPEKGKLNLLLRKSLKSQDKVLNIEHRYRDGGIAALYDKRAAGNPPFEIFRDCCIFFINA